MKKLYGLLYHIHPSLGNCHLRRSPAPNFQRIYNPDTPNPDRSMRKTIGTQSQRSLRRMRPSNPLFILATLKTFGKTCLAKIIIDHGL